MRRLTLKAALVAATFLIAGPALAETVAIINARILTAGPAGEIASGTVVIKDQKIAAVGAGAAVPAGARVIDAQGGVVTPGFVASDSALGAVEVGALGDDVTATNPDLGAAFDVQYGLNPDSVLIPVARMGGITRAIVTPTPSGSGLTAHEHETAGGEGEGLPRTTRLFSGQAAVIQLAEGSTDMVVRAKVAQVSPWGEQGADIAGGTRGIHYVAVKNALDDVRWYMRNRAAFNQGATRGLVLSRADLEALVPVVEGRMPLILYANKASDIRTALKLAREENIRIIIDGANEGWRVAREIAAARVPVIVYPLQDLPSDFESVGSTLENAGILAKAGVTVVLKAAEGGAHRVRETRYDAGNAVAHGMPYQAALEAITINPAKVFGVADSMGSLEVGKDADVVVWTGDPFEPLSQPVAVFIQGKQQPLTSRQEKLRQRYQDLNRPYPPAYSY
jgi:imidazolonepropionase-like amidohydrolase